MLSHVSLPGRTVESMVFTLLGLLTRRASCEGCRSKLHFFYTHLTKYYSNSAQHSFLLITINGQASARQWQGTQYSTRPNDTYNEILATQNQWSHKP